MMRRALMLTAAALAATAMSATAAQASGVVDGTTGTPCPAVSLSGNTVTGGCLVEDVAGEWTLMAGPTPVATCPLTFDFRVAGGGGLYVVNQDGGICSGFQRRPCLDDVTGETIPWRGIPVSIPGVGLKEKINMCFELVSGGPGSWENVTYTVDWDANDYFDGFTQYGSSQTAAIANAAFSNPNSTAIKIVD